MTLVNVHPKHFKTRQALTIILSQPVSISMSPMNSRQPDTHSRWFKALLILLILLAPLASAVLSAAEPVRFGRDVLPILSANCFACHGPDEKNRKAGLRLDVEADAKAKRQQRFSHRARTARKKSDPRAPDQHRSRCRDAAAEPHKQVNAEQIETLRRWIAEGATWGSHWSFEPVTRPVIAASKQLPIDALVNAALAKERSDAASTRRAANAGAPVMA